MLLFGSLIGSYFEHPDRNALPHEKVMSNQVIGFSSAWMQRTGGRGLDRTVVIAINVGGAVIPTLMWLLSSLCTKVMVNGAIIALALHWLANPVPT